MRTIFRIFGLTLFPICVFAQPKILHYTETSGFDHNTRTLSLAMFQVFATEHNLQVDDDQTGDAFNSMANLQQYEVVVFSNTSGNAILDATQRANFEAYIAGGGSYLGIHAATDTYRHSTANGNNTGTWDFYAELVGASVQENPNHVSGTPSYTMTHFGSHPSLDNIPSPWTKNEEYYYWESGYFGNSNTVVLEVEETVGPNNQVNSYDSTRPMSWYRTLPNGGKMFYTALGHAASNYSNDNNLIAHIEDALLWILDITVGASEAFHQAQPFSLFQKEGAVEIQLPTAPSNATITIFNLLGQPVWTEANFGENVSIELNSGAYIVQVQLNGATFNEKIVIPTR